MTPISGDPDEGDPNKDDVAAGRTGVGRAPGEGGAVRTTRRPSELILVTGRSGAGRTTAMAVLEDLGFDRVDGAPLTMIPSIAAELLSSGRRLIAIGVDARTAGYSADAFDAVLQALRAAPFERFAALFLDGRDEALRRRYSETRRRHPLAPEGGVDEGLALDRRATLPLKDLVDRVIDTSDLSPNELRRRIVQLVAPTVSWGMTVEVMSFAYKYGLPPEADVVFDCRFLRNPHYVSHLRVLDGRDPAVAAHVEGDPLYASFFQQVIAHLQLVRPAFEASGKGYLTVAFGCTGGKHRSVALAERVAAAIGAGDAVRLRHRERERAAASAPAGARPAEGENS
ncbi:MAG: RNase adapter RapZ [Pseudomonadota bacterium]